MVKYKSIYFKILIGISTLAILFHLLILIKIIPYEITWGGNLKTNEDMYVFETFSIFVNAFYIFILLQKGNYLKSFFGKKTLTIILWIFFSLFSLNTIGNLFAKTNFEKLFAILTLLNSIFIWKINKNTYN